MTEAILKSRDWSPERKRKKLNEKDFQEQMEVDVTSWIGENLINQIEDMMVDEEFVEMCFRQAERMEVSVCSGLNSVGRSASRSYCARKKLKRLCRKRKRSES